jgi:catechol 2,3-dioxygenase-like lactoylglutathione lyase family enzyme
MKRKLNLYFFIVGCLFLTHNLKAQKVTELQKIKIYSITFSVQDIEKTAEWYKSKLGFREIDKKTYPEFNTSLIFFELNGYRVELIKDGNAKEKSPVRVDPPAHTSIVGQAQFCFYTDNLNGLEKELISKSIPIVWKFQNEQLNVKFLFIRDPEGNLIQFLQKLK